MKISTLIFEKNRQRILDTFFCENCKKPKNFEIIYTKAENGISYVTALCRHCIKPCNIFSFSILYASTDESVELICYNLDMLNKFSINKSYPIKELDCKPETFMCNFHTKKPSIAKIIIDCHGKEGMDIINCHFDNKLFEIVEN